MKKKFLFLATAVTVLFLDSTDLAALTVDGSTAPGTKFVGKKEYGELLPPVTIFFGDDGAPTPVTVTHALGAPVNERGFIWSKDSFVVFGASTGFFTTGTASVLFSSPSPAVDVVGLYSATPAAGVIVGSIGYGFPSGTSFPGGEFQPWGTYYVTIGINLVESGETVGFSLKWEIVPHFLLSITDLDVPSGKLGDFGTASFGEPILPQTFIFAIETNFYEHYVVTISTPGIFNEFGTELKGVKLFSDGVSGEKIKGAKIPISTVTPLVSDTEIVVYESGSKSGYDGPSDFATAGIAIEPPIGQMAGTYEGTIIVTLMTK